MNSFQPIYDLAALCVRKGLKNTVLCPGSRCAPLTLAFTRNPDIRAMTISDERSAGFIGLGMAQQTKLPTILVCTSGTAAYNFSPAVAEACFSHTPLLVFTADRPAEWIGQHDGQTVFQSEIFGKHVKKSFQLPQEFAHPDSQWAVNRIVNDAINLAMQEPAGPVHINTPFREPLYPTGATEPSGNIRVIDDQRNDFNLSEKSKQQIREQLPKFNHILIVGGQHERDELVLSTLRKLSETQNIPVVGDLISNLHPLKDTIRHADSFLAHATDDVKQSLAPDLLITFGKSVISKNLKLFLRKFRAKEHWHLQPAGDVADTFQSVTNIFRTTPSSFFTYASTISNQDSFSIQRQSNYKELWQVEERKTSRSLTEFFPQDNFGEFELVSEVLANLPERSNLHLSNSMSVRYANLIGLQAEQKDITVFANRGTSGIDGCTSTAVGHSLINGNPHVLITGDMAFFYDRNAFWHNYPVANLRVVLLNNHGGVIFKMIDGPGSVPESDEFFVTQQKLTATYICQEFGFDHLKLDSKRKLKNLLKDFFDFDGKTKVLEIESDAATNKSIFDNLKQRIRKNYES